MKPFDDNLDFVISCKYSGAISHEELETWCYRCIKIQENIPILVFDLLDVGIDAFRELKNEVFLRDHGGKRLTKGEDNAVLAIGYLRGINTEEELKDLRTSSQTVLKALEKNPHILERFKEVFPFIELDF
ncbi:MAG: hypothetical protein KF798_06630 [Candidatus Paracaedibacteraceae bacterium]|nr:hypothetical protein [Candidatus Paracaedibacteraceae bacterium]